MRILIGFAWTYLVVAELIGEKSGISAFIYQQQRYRHFDNVYASIVMIGLIGLVVDQCLAQLGRVLFPWESGSLWSRRVRQALGVRAQRVARSFGGVRLNTLRGKSSEDLEREGA
jgi:hypothetical protein